MKLVSFPKLQAIGQEKTTSGCARGGLDWKLGRLSSLKGLSSIGTGCPGKWLSHHAWRYLRRVDVALRGACCSGGLGNVMSMVELDDPKGLFQPK